MNAVHLSFYPRVFTVYKVENTGHRRDAVPGTGSSTCQTVVEWEYTLPVHVGCFSTRMWSSRVWPSSIPRYDMHLSSKKSVLKGKATEIDMEWTNMYKSPLEEVTATNDFNRGTRFPSPVRTKLYYRHVCH